MRLLLLPLIAALLLAFAAAPLPAQDTPAAGLTFRAPGSLRIEGEPPALTDFSIDVAFPNLRFSRPTYITHPRDGTDRLFVLEQDGLISVFENRRDVKQAEVVLDLRDVVRREHNEEGLLGLAFHPQFRTNGYIYVNYSATPRRNVISRFTLDAKTHSVADPGSERVILEVKQPWGNHNGGMIEFGPDGCFYITFGDGGSGGDPLNSGQDRTSLLGKILRIDVDRTQGKRAYAIPEGNPFRGAQDGTREEIWAYGLRNVWRFSFDRGSGALWAGDVGQNTWEEVDIIRKGRNYGWHVYEGLVKFAGGRRREREDAPAATEFEPPVITYGHDVGDSVTGGYVYRGAKLPGLLGAYLYADYDSGKIWALRYNAAGEVENRQIASGRSIASFGEDRDGEIYFCSFDKRIYRLIPAANQPASVFPQRLSETGVFKDLVKLTPRASLIPYSVNVPLWSDGAEKERYVSVPGEQKIAFAADGSYRFPAGTIFVKTFFQETTHRRLETRLLIVGDDGVAGYTYAWNDEQTDALLLNGAAERTDTVEEKGKKVERTWAFPSRADCLRCHTPAAGYVLGFNTRQLNREHDYSGKKENQLAAYRRIGLFDKDPGDIAKLPAHPVWSDDAAPLEKQVRAYLEANCAQCHAPGATGGGAIDLRASTPLDAMRMIDAEPSQGDLGVKGARLVTPGKPEASLLWLRMRATGAGAMPPLARQRVDERAVEKVKKWIEGLGR